MNEAGGQIVKKEWLIDCHSKKKLLDEKLYEFQKHTRKESDESAGPRKTMPKRNATKKSYKESDDDEDSDDRNFIADSDDDDDDEDDKDDYENSTEEEDEETPTSSTDNDEYHDKISNKKIQTRKYKKRHESNSSDSESERRVERHKERKPIRNDQSDSDKKVITLPNVQRNKAEPVTKSTDSDDDVVTPKNQSEPYVKSKKDKKKIDYEDSQNETTDDNKQTEKSQSSTSSTDANSDLDLSAREPWELPDLFLNKNFYIYGNYKIDEIRLLNRIVVAYAGSVHNYLSEKIDFVITDYEWNADFDKVRFSLFFPKFSVFFKMLN